jgi:hypothetical protein
MRHKVLIETSVLVSGSVYSAKNQIAQIKHKFFDRSKKLFDFIARQHEIGVITQTVEQEAANALEDAVNERLGKVAPNVKSTVLNLCWDRMTDLVATLVKEDVDVQAVNRNLTRVVTMYGQLLGQARSRSSRAQAAAQSRIVPPYLKKLANSIYAHQFLRDVSQTTRLLRNFPGIKDQTILAEAAYLLVKYSQDEETEMFLASADCAFSPTLDPDGSMRSNTVTMEIHQHFGVTCDWPERIFFQLKPFYP